MRKVFEASGKTVDAAIDAACLLAGTTVDMVEIEVNIFNATDELCNTTNCVYFINTHESAMKNGFRYFELEE